MSERRFRRTSGEVSLPVLHVVRCPRYRRGIPGGPIATRCDGLLEQFADEHGWEIVAREVISDHVHLNVRIGPADVPSRVVRAFTGRATEVLRSESANLWRLAKVLWSPSNVVASVGDVSELTARHYIEHQWGAVAP